MNITLLAGASVFSIIMQAAPFEDSGPLMKNNEIVLTPLYTGAPGLKWLTPGK